MLFASPKSTPKFSGAFCPSPINLVSITRPLDYNTPTMFFLIVIVLLVVFQGRSTHLETSEMWFMLSMFAGGAYVAGFLDSRLFARLDQNNANMLAEAEMRYEQNINAPPLAEAND